ncbi:hypothetical protein SAMN05421771_2294 [Granulicella pectinivorans]|uniref:DUF4962 domain-containing protein n=1 Tax=Granulicella pectinivorans TaxID=474950 RepID=A0A1I6MCL7_9BACT|nr:hypothetical protein [Granulicella pectinivorans]SFS13401.1 hypothetical protein SAMN05421771_2294 [Granulicella pectinivorans]
MNPNYPKEFASSNGTPRALVISTGAKRSGETPAFRFCCCLFFALLTIILPLQAAPRPHHPSELPQNSLELFTDMMRVADANFDPTTHLVNFPGQNNHPRLVVRETSWYALGLLLRDANGDRANAAAALEAVLANQYLDPKTKWYGTFRRTPSEPLPPANAIDFNQFDPNWRVFIGTTFQMILADFPERIPAALAQRLYQSIDIAVKGEKQEGRLTPTYTNPALMYGALWDFIAAHNHDTGRLAEATAWNAEVYRLFKLHNAFGEYNSPTYYGTDLYGLGLWRIYGSSPAMRAHGAEMEATLWTDIADFYQPNLRNIAGPYDRSYGMDMETYTSLMGLWIRTLLPAAKAPLPALTATGDHALDNWFVPMVVLLGSPVPSAARAKFEHFAGPHQVTRQITDQRKATAWIGTDVLFGAESTHQTVGVDGHSQFHPATIQWRTPSGAIGWINITHTPPIDATASQRGIAIFTAGDVTFLIHAPGINPGDITASTWNLPGLPLKIGTSATATVTLHGDDTEITYKSVQTLVINRS